MITIDEILDKYHIWTTQDSEESIIKEDVKSAIIEYGTELLKYAAEKAKVEYMSIPNDQPSSSFGDEYDYFVNKNSILNIIKELK